MLDQMNMEPDTADLETALRLAKMNSATRQSSISSVRKIREIMATGGRLTVAELRLIVEAPDRACRTALGPRHSQLLCDARRALRQWDDEPLRRQALRCREGLPTLLDASEAAQRHFGQDRAKRAYTALVDLAKLEATSLDGVAATLEVVEPVLRAASPEALGVRTAKSLDNKIGLIRAAVRLVDPLYSLGREADVKSLSAPWKHDLDALLERTPGHSKSVAAIFRRLALQSDRTGKSAADLSMEDLEDFVAQERKTKAPTHEEKLRMAAKIWNQAIEDGVLDAIPFDRKRNVTRLPDVKWESVPEMFRAPLEELFASADNSKADLQWSDLIDRSDDADLGVPGVDDDEREEDQGAQIVEMSSGTKRNWQDAVKRIWHAVASDPLVETKPQVFSDLWDARCVQAFVRAAWNQRRQRFEAEGKEWGANKKGRYEISVLQTFVAVGKALGVSEERIQKIVTYSHKIDPAILGKKKMPDGSEKTIYEDRRIGPRHAEMLQAFNEDSVMARWFEAPDKLWALAMKGKKRKNGPTLGDVALARSALIARIEQRVCPLRRINVARLRCQGAMAHIQLPARAGEGRLILPAVEMKNLRRIEVRIDPETVEMLREFIEVFRPVSLRETGGALENEHLFPGCGTERKEVGASAPYASGFGYHTPNKLSSTFAKHLRRQCNLKIDMHVMRHIAGKVILDVDPSAMALVQEVLGHKSLKTTQSYYAEVSKIVAQRRYLELLDRATRRALTALEFRVDLEKHLEGR